MQKHPFILVLAVLLSCNKEDAELSKADPEGNGGRLVVNEVMATHSEQENEFGEASDWFELYNPGDEFTLLSGQWFVTDDLEGDPHKYELPEVTIGAEGFLVVWCDGLDQEGADIHTNFKLSPNDGVVALVHNGTLTGLIVSEAPIAASPSPIVSFGRTPDGTALWTALSPPTPGAPNELPAAAGN